MNTATKFTMLRILMIPLFMVCMYWSKSSDIMCYVALAVFGAASLTDLIDGHIARKYNQITDLGKFLDPLADKVLVLAAMAIFCEWGMFPAWALMLVLTREFAVSGLRMVASGKGKVIAAGILGKVKTVSQIVLILWLMIFRLPVGGFWLSTLCALWVAAITLWSGADYLWKGKQFLQE